MKRHFFITNLAGLPKYWIHEKLDRNKKRLFEWYSAGVIHWVPLTTGTLGPAYNRYTGSRLQRVHWVPLTMGTLGPTYNEYTGSHLQWVHWVTLTTGTLGPAYNGYTGSRLQGVHWVPLTMGYTGSRIQGVHWVPLIMSNEMYARKLLVVSRCSLQMNFITLPSMIWIK